MEFQNICSLDPGCIVDLVNYSDDSNFTHLFELQLQYIPNFYMMRTINKPGLELEGTCGYLKQNKSITCYIGREEIYVNGRSNVRYEFDKPLLRELNECSRLKLEPHKTLNMFKSFVQKLKEGGELNFESYNNKYVAFSSDEKKDFMDHKDFPIEPVEISEDDLSLEKNQFIVLSDEPGMGKSTTVITLANKILQQNLYTNNINFLIVIELKTLK